MGKINLFQANSIVNTNDDLYVKNKILEGTYYGLKDYLTYIDESIKVVQKEGAITIPLKREEVEIENESSKNNKSKERQFQTRFYIDSEKVKSEKTLSKIENELFERGDRVKTYSSKPTGDWRKDKENEVEIIDRNGEEKYLILEEDFKKIYLKANDSQLRKQKKAVQILQNQPLGAHTPLQKLFGLASKTVDYFEENLNDIYLEKDGRNNFTYPIDWEILNKPDEYDGTDQQQEFVRKALATNDFALLEGPPGSGKTTAIIELIIQLIKENKRVLLVSATHIAVDNVIHRVLETYKEQCEGLVVPLRIATNEGLIGKESVKPYLFKSFIKKTKKEIRKNLETKPQTESSKMLKDSLGSFNKESKDFDDIILKSANLVGGTMMGILQHPDIKRDGIQEQFDVMIVDEASKVTFLDFLVPALYAKKWILVGDVNQLSPYTEDDFINENIKNVIQDENSQNNLAKTFELNRKLTSDYKSDKESVKVFFTTDYNIQFDEEINVFKMGDRFNSQKDELKLNGADVVLCNPLKKHRDILAKHLFVKAQFFEDKVNNVFLQHRQNAHHRNGNKKSRNDVYNYEFLNGKQEWPEMVGSRLSQMYQYRFEPQLHKEIKQEFNFLVPEEFQEKIEGIRRVALPSILEMLQIGVGEKQRTTKDGRIYTEEKLIYTGFEDFDDVKELKFQSLTYQHRMHDEIASIPREYFYKGKNLKTANTVEGRPDKLGFYKLEESKVIWVKNIDSTFRKGKIPKNINPKEVDDIQKELEGFIEKSIRQDNEFEVAVLTFYRQQETELKKMLRELTKQHHKNKFFSIENVKITLCTVDKFQGDEADLVLLSFTKFTKKAFYNSPNRLNVALTRARYKLVLFGNQGWLAKNAQLEGLRKLAETKKSRLTQ